VGPTVLGGQVAGVVDGAVAGGLAGSLFPTAGVDALTLIGGLGMILYMLLVGMTVDPAPFARRAGTMLVMALAVVGATGVVAVGAAAWLGSSGGWRGPRATSAGFQLALLAG